MGSIRNKIKNILRENLLRENEEMDELLDLINRKEGIEYLNKHDLEDAPQELINQFMDKIIRLEKPISTEILHLVDDQDRIDQYLMGKIKRHEGLDIMELQKASKHVVDEYVGQMGDKGHKIRPRFLKFASQEVADEYIKKLVDKGTLPDPEHLGAASPEAREYYRNNKPQTPHRKVQK